MIMLELICDAPGCARVASETTAASIPRLSHTLFDLLEGGWTVDSVALSHAYCPDHRQLAQPSRDATLDDFLMHLGS